MEDTPRRTLGRTRRTTAARQSFRELQLHPLQQKQNNNIFIDTKKQREWKMLLERVSILVKNDKSNVEKLTMRNVQRDSKRETDREGDSER